VAPIAPACGVRPGHASPGEFDPRSRRGLFIESRRPFGMDCQDKLRN
jgi:hypothetical protein